MRDKRDGQLTLPLRCVFVLYFLLPPSTCPQPCTIHVLSPQGAGQSLVQGAKEGLVGAYDAAAGAAASAADTIKHTAAQATGSADSSSSSSSSAGQPAPSGGDSIGDGFGHGSGSSSSPSGGGYAGGERSSLGQAWEDLKHGGAKAPRAVSSAVSGIALFGKGMPPCAVLSTMACGASR
jgi:hypothetical protein